VRTLKLVVSYDGSPFVGWQRQADGVSIQSLLEEALGRIEGRPVAVAGAGRTDAGVHALAQVASCSLHHPIPTADLRRALNAQLPPEVRVTAVDEAPDGFHARYSSRAKTYRYAILNSAANSPFLYRYAWHVNQPLSVEPMAAAAGALEGAHDFAVFQSAGSSARTTTRTIHASSVVADAACVNEGTDAVESSVSRILAPPDPAARLILYEVCGDGFLRHMVRAIVGSLVEVGLRRREPAWFAELLQASGRAAAGPTAPAHGLWLVRVDY
jgi:tRNA pseudouridine38-40 synthase